ncbi:hypothetical protein BD779DRAFT_1678787 [Infundibulicybe gibba]|nr:hypothetical protein BD779DRAFT_1678787 [Infundibulicybe gibba]
MPLSQILALQEIFSLDMSEFSGDFPEALSMDLEGDILMSLEMGSFPPVDPGETIHYPRPDIYQTAPPLIAVTNYFRGSEVRDLAHTGGIYYNNTDHFEADWMSSDIIAWGSPPQDMDYQVISRADDHPSMGNSPAVDWNLNIRNPFSSFPFDTSQSRPSQGVGSQEFGYFAPYGGISSSSADLSDPPEGQTTHSGCSCPVANPSCSQLDAFWVSDHPPRSPMDSASRSRRANELKNGVVVSGRSRTMHVFTPQFNAPDTSYS